MEALRTLAILLPLGLSSGINLYATILVAGLTIRLGLVHNVPGGLDVLGTWPVIAVAGVLFVIEFLADKVPFVDNAWDVLHTLIRPIGATLLGWAALSQADPVVGVLGALAMGSVALVSHTAKAGTRVALNVASPLENISNTGLSLAEDAAAGGLAFLAMTYPLIAGGIAVVLLVILIVVVPQVLRWAWFTVGALAAWIRGLTGSKRTTSDPLPVSQNLLLGGQIPELVVCCKAQNIKETRGRSGYLVLLADRLAYTYEGRSGAQMWSISRAQIRTVRLKQGTLADVLDIEYTVATGKAKPVTLVFLKDRADLAEQIALRVAAPAPSILPAVLPAGTP
jgi:hypothetical protein